MATQVQRRRGTTAQHAAFSGQLAELTVDTDKMTVVVQDGATLGGYPLATEANLTAHLTDVADAHDASAISVLDTGGYFTATDVEAALQELGASWGAGGAYTPTLYNVTGVSSSSLISASYTVVGGIVTVAVIVSLTTSTTSPVLLGVSLPVASTFATIYDVVGTLGTNLDSSSVFLTGHCEADTINNRLSIRFGSNATFGALVHAVAQYKVL